VPAPGPTAAPSRSQLDPQRGAASLRVAVAREVAPVGPTKTAACVSDLLGNRGEGNARCVLFVVKKWVTRSGGWPREAGGAVTRPEKTSVFRKNGRSGGTSRGKIGRASCRERVAVAVGAGS